MLHRDIGEATEAAREATTPVTKLKRFKAWLCKHDPGAVYAAEKPGEGRHTFSRGWHSWGPGVTYQCGRNFYNIHACRICDLMLHDHIAFNPSPPPPVDKPNPDPMPAAPPGMCWHAEITHTGDVKYVTVQLLNRNSRIDSVTESCYFFGVYSQTPHEAAVKAARTILARRDENLQLRADLGIT